MLAKGAGTTARSVGRARELEPGHRRDGIALALLGIAFLIAASSWFDAARPVGAWIDYGVRTVIGSAVVVLPVLLLALAITLMRTHPNPDARPRLILGAAMIGLPVLGLWHVWAGAPNEPGERRGAAGFVGFVIGGPLSDGLTVWIATPLLIMGVLFGLLLVTGTTIRELPDTLRYMVSGRLHGDHDEEYDDSRAGYVDDDFSDDFSDGYYDDPTYSRDEPEAWPGSDQTTAAMTRPLGRTPMDNYPVEPAADEAPTTPEPAAKPRRRKAQNVADPVPTKKAKADDEGMKLDRVIEGDYTLPPLDLLVEQARRSADLQRQPVQALGLLVQAPAHRPLQRHGQRLQTRQCLAAQGRGQLGRSRGRGRSQIGRQFGQAGVGLVADATHHRQLAAGHGTHHGLVVEGPQVFQGSPAAADDQHVGLQAGIGQADGPHDLRRCLRSLHQAGIDHHLQLGCTPGDGRQHVMQRRRAQRRDHPHSARMQRQRPLALGIEQARRRQACLELEEQLVQRAFAQALQVLHHALQFATRFIHRDAAPQLHLLAVGGPEVEQAGRPAEHGAAQQRLLAFAVLQAEVAMAAGGTGETGDLAAHGDRAQARRQRIGHGQQQAGHAPGAARHDAAGRLRQRHRQPSTGPVQVHVSDEKSVASICSNPGQSQRIRGF